MRKAPRKSLPVGNWADFRKPDDGELEAMLDAQREAYSLAIDGMMNKSAEAFEGTEYGQFPVQDIALFAVFLGAVKMVELSGQPMEKKSILSALNFLLTRAEREIPTHVHALLDSVANRPVGHA